MSSCRGISIVRWVSLAVAVGMFGQGCATTSATQPAGAQWYEVRSPRFQLWTDGDPEEARRLVTDLERFHQVAMSTTSAQEREAAPPLRIFLAKDDASFKSLLPGTAKLARGYFVPTSRGNYAILAGSDGEASSLQGPGGRTLLFHEYAHYILSLDGARVPSWYNEGFAEYMAQTQFRDGTYKIGCPPLYRAAWAQQLRWLPLAQVMDAENAAALVQDEGGFVRARGDTVAYAQSWYLFHYFAVDGERQSQLRKYLQLWDGGAATEAATEAAIQSAFGQSSAQLDAVIRAYASRPTIECVSIIPERALATPQVAVKVLPPAEAYSRVGDLLLTMFGPADVALSMLQSAAKAGDDAAVMRSLARAHYLKAKLGQADAPQETQQAEQLLQQSRKLAPDDPEGFVLEGHLQRLAAERLQPTDADAALEQVTAARKAYRKAIRADEALAEAYLGLGATYLLADNGSEEAVAALEVAAFLLPLETEHALDLGRIQLKRENMLQAIPPLEYVVRWSQDQVVRAEARGVLERLRTMAAPAAAPAAGTSAPAPAVSSVESPSVAQPAPAPAAAPAAPSVPAAPVAAPAPPPAAPAAP